jgi:molecular chaperone GrpE
MFEELKPEFNESRPTTTGPDPGPPPAGGASSAALPPGSESREIEAGVDSEDLTPLAEEEDAGETSLFPVEREEDSELQDWKEALREDFGAWLETVDRVPEPEGPDAEEPGEGPDLYSFYEELATANAESRKANRRTAEAISQWGDVLGRFESGLAPLRETVAQLAAAQPKEGRLTRVHCLALIELLDRLRRIEKAFGITPAGSSWWGGSAVAEWRKSWERQRQAFAIVVAHLDEWLRKEGVRRFETLGQPFDPLRMTAVAAEPDASRPPQTVIEEIASGYLREDELLRPAQVKVSSQP